MRVIGLGWVEFRTHWSSGQDDFVGTVSDLTAHLADILEDEGERQIPDCAPAPIMQRKTFKQLGQLTEQAEQLADQRLSLSSSQLLAAAEEKRRQLEAAGELDTVHDQQPNSPPPIDDRLVGRQLEILGAIGETHNQVKGGKRNRSSFGVKVR
mmetsp:Transcript_21081/g.52568  ORF Transcript_21081/g.52568 Transcript_21081/m.52568 type:complete len:153 (+) Transcript_21081:818-1276(+)